VNGARRRAKISRARQRALLHFDLLRETWTRTNLQVRAIRDLVNLERSPRLTVGRRHFVTGHIDGIGKIARWERAGGDHVSNCRAARCPSLCRVQRIDRGGWHQPHCRRRDEEGLPHLDHSAHLEVTALRERKAGDAVNLRRTSWASMWKTFSPIGEPAKSWLILTN
jgi:hypothetical protein